MRVLIFEFVTGGGFVQLPGSPFPEGRLLDEGRAMAQAIVRDFSRLPVQPADLVVLRDSRLRSTIHWPQCSFRDIDGEAASKCAAELALAGAEARTLGLRCDVTSERECREALSAVIDAWGGVDLLVNNAGLTHVGLIRETDSAILQRVLDVNFFGAVHLTRALRSLLHGFVHLESHGGFGMPVDIDDSFDTAIAMVIAAAELTARGDHG